MSKLIQSAVDPTDCKVADCNVAEHWNDTTVIISCGGVLDMLTAPALERRIALALEKQPKLMIVDLTAVEFLASHGMNVLVATHRLCSAATEFAVVANGHVTRRPMELIGLTEILTVHATVDEALGELAA